MTRFIALLPLVIACTNEATLSADELDETYDGATLRIVQPTSGSFLALEDSHEFLAELTDAEGEPLDFDAIRWTASSDETWAREGAAFTEDQLDVGLHDLTAEVTLPNGDRLAHTVGGVLLQSKYAGTYSGLFTSDVTYDEYTVPCSGTVLLIVDPYGDVAAGQASCIAGLMGFELPVDYLFDLDNDDGAISGTAAVDLGGWFELDFPADGTLNLDDESLDVTFGGDQMGMIAIDGAVETDRVTREAGL